MDIANLTPGNIIRIFMILLLAAGLLAQIVNTANIGNEKKIDDKYYHSNIASTVLLTLYIIYTILLEHDVLPK
jgi:hypothetical protein